MDDYSQQINYKNELNKHMKLSNVQKEAVEHLGTPTLVVAGAGSGKTRTLTSKIAFLIEKNYKPERILAITFTNKAAEEMKDRLIKETDIPFYKFKWVRTFHSACFMILKEHCHLLNYDKPIQIFSNYQHKKNLKEIVDSLNIDKKHLPSIIQTISMAKNSGNPLKYLDMAMKSLPVQISDIFKEYEKRLKKQNAVDFDNIILKTRDLLKQESEIRKYYQNFFQYILVDEYQDTNNLQEEITRLLLKKDNLFCVGDDWQAVYGFRGSNINHFLSFQKKYSNAKLFYLEENYRSSDKIVKTANRLIDINKNKIEKKCFSSQKAGFIKIINFQDEYAEASFIARKIANMHNDDEINYENFAIIYRTKLISLNFEKIFRLSKIPYHLKGSQGFFERKEITDIISYLLVAVFTKDNASFERILNIPRRGIGAKAIEKLKKFQDEGLSESLYDATEKILGKKILRSKIEKELTVFLNHLKKIAEQNSFDAINIILEDVGYLEYIKSYSETETEFENRRDNIEEFLFYAKKKPSLLEFLEEVSLIKEDRKDTDEEDKGVSLLTAHSSKGLEFETVFIVGCEDELFPHWKSMGSSFEIQEERRLMYVAMTRAKKNLFLTYADNRKNLSRDKSRFLFEIETFE